MVFEIYKIELCFKKMFCTRRCIIIVDIQGVIKKSAEILSRYSLLSNGTKYLNLPYQMLGILEVHGVEIIFKFFFIFLTYLYDL